jgi:hypothetical protein
VSPKNRKMGVWGYCFIAAFLLRRYGIKGQIVYSFDGGDGSNWFHEKYKNLHDTNYLVW